MCTSLKSEIIKRFFYSNFWTIADQYMFNPSLAIGIFKGIIDFDWEL